MRVEYRQQEIPRSLVDCADRPPLPAGNGPNGELLGSQVVGWALQVAVAHEDCKRKNAEIGRLTAPDAPPFERQ